MRAEQQKGAFPKSLLTMPTFSEYFGHLGQLNIMFYAKHEPFSTTTTNFRMITDLMLHVDLLVSFGRL